MDAEFCLSVLQLALAKHDAPEIFNTDQGSQFTSHLWVNAIKVNEIKISMDGKGRWADNVYIERLWRTIKHEHLCFYALSTIKELHQSIETFVRFYNYKRLHQTLGYHTPEEVYRHFWAIDPIIHYSQRPGYDIKYNKS